MMIMNVDIYNALTAAIDRDKLIQRLCELVAIRSENPFGAAPGEGRREKEIGEYYADALHRLGLDVDYNEIRPGRPNVFGRRRGSGGGMTLMLAGHLDTVDTRGYDDAYDVRLEDGKVFGRGACDMKGALAAYLEVARLIKEADLNLKGHLIIGGVADEEHRMIGSRHVGANGPRADRGIIGEPSDLDVCPANKGQLGVIIRTLGRAVHSSIPEKGVNAIVHMAKVIEAFADYNTALLNTAPHPLCGHGRFSPGVIRGGNILSTVPDRCALEVERRIIPGETVPAVLAELRARLDRLAQTVPDFKYEMTAPTWDIPANDVPVTEPVVQSLLKAHAEVIGKPARVRAFAAGTDAPNLGFPAVICGPGSIDQAHSLNEYLAVDQLVAAVKIYLWCVLDLLG